MCQFYYFLQNKHLELLDRPNELVINWQNGDMRFVIRGNQVLMELCCGQMMSDLVFGWRKHCFIRALQTVKVS